MVIKTNSSKTLLKLALELKAVLSNCGYVDIVSISRGDKEKTEPLDFAVVPLPRVIIGERADFTTKLDTLPFINTVAFTNESGEIKYMKGKEVSSSLEFDISIFSKDLELARTLAMAIVNFLSTRKVISFPLEVMDGDKVVGLIADGETLALKSDEITFSHDAMEQTIVYKLLTELKYDLRGVDYREVEAPYTVKDGRVDGITAKPPYQPTQPCEEE